MLEKNTVEQSAPISESVKRLDPLGDGISSLELVRVPDRMLMLPMQRAYHTANS